MPAFFNIKIVYTVYCSLIFKHNRTVTRMILNLLDKCLLLMYSKRKILFILNKFILCLTFRGGFRKNVLQYKNRKLKRCSVKFV